MNDFDYRYVLMLDDNNTPVAITSFYTVTTDIAIFANPTFRRVLESIRRRFPRFLKFRMLEWGTPITVSSPPFAFRPGISPLDIIKHMQDLLLATAKCEGQFLIVIRDFEDQTEEMQSALTRSGFTIVNSLPNTYLKISWLTTSAYHAAMKSYFRSKLFKHLRKNTAQGIRYELVDDFASLADTLCAQWMVVHEQADEFQREVLTPLFYREYSHRLGTNSKALLFYKSNQLIGHALLLLDGKMLRWLYFGRTRAANDSLYLYVAHSVIETAIKLDVEVLEMGLTTYPIKLDLGARVQPIQIGLRSPWAFVNPFISLGYSVLNRTPKLTNRAVFK